MKNYLFAIAFIAALAGCSQNDTGRMGSAGTSDTGTSSSSNDNRAMSGSSSVQDANSGAAAGSLSISTNSSYGGPSGSVSGSAQVDQSTSSTSTTTSQPSNPTELNQADTNAPVQPNTTGDRSNGDLTNRPQGAPGHSDVGFDSSYKPYNSDTNQSASDLNKDEHQSKSAPQP